MIQEIMLRMIFYFKQDAKRINHAIKVYAFASTISSLENMSADEQLIIDYAAILHDIGIKESELKYNSTAGKYQEIEGPPIAKKILIETGVSAPLIGRICFIIGHHHSYNKIDGRDFQVLVEADFLVNIFEENLKRDSINSIKDRIFKTSAGIKLLETIYLK